MVYMTLHEEPISLTTSEKYQAQEHPFIRAFEMCSLLGTVIHLNLGPAVRGSPRLILIQRGPVIDLGSHSE
jgi:hypothetical protein